MYMFKRSPGWGRGEGLLLRGVTGSLNPRKEETEASTTSLNLMHPVFTAVVNRLISQRLNKALINCVCIHSHRGVAHPGPPPPPVHHTSRVFRKMKRPYLCFVLSSVQLRRMQFTAPIILPPPAWCSDLHFLCTCLTARRLPGRVGLPTCFFFPSLEAWSPFPPFFIYAFIYVFFTPL